jgi:cytochrome c2
MRLANKLLTLALVGLPLTGLVLAAKSPKDSKAAEIARGKYLVNYGGCNDCHTPMKMTEHGPAPDLARSLSGHPEGLKLPPPELKPGPWFAATAGMTAWAGPWGISYAANLTPDQATGMGVWDEAMFIKAMRTGKHMGHGRAMLPPMPWRALAGLNDSDLKAIFAYLRSVPAVVNHVPGPVPPHGETNFE